MPFGVGYLGIAAVGEEAAPNGTLTFTGVVADGQTVTIGADVYEFDTNASVTTGRILVDVTAAQTAVAAVTALVLAINTLGTELVTAVDGAGDTVVVTSNGAGSKVATTETCVNASWGAVSLVNHWAEEALVTQRVPMISCSIDDNQALNRSTALEGRAMERPPDFGTIAVGGDLAHQARYTNTRLLLKHLLGNLVGGLYSMRKFREGMGLTVAIDKQVSVWSASGGKVSQIVFASAIDRVTITASLIFKNLIRNSVINTLPVLRALVDTDINVLQRHLTFWLGDQTDALQASDARDSVGVTVTLARTVDQVFTNQGPYIIEPLDNDFPTFTMELPTARHLDDQFKTWQAANTPLQARALYAFGGKSLEIIFPSLNIVSAPTPTDGPAPLATTVSLHASEGQVEYTATDISAASADNSLNSAGATLPYVHAGAQVYIRGFTGTLANNSVGIVVSWTAAKVILSGITLVTDAAGEAVTLRFHNPPIIVREV